MRPRDGWPLDDSLLVASELVNNAVLHSGCSTDDLLRVEVRSTARTLTISVHDPGVSGRAATRVDRAGRPFGGWGLQIVETLARRWGTERLNGYLVWAELPIGTG